MDSGFGFRVSVRVVDFGVDGFGFGVKSRLVGWSLGSSKFGSSRVGIWVSRVGVQVWVFARVQDSGRCFEFELVDLGFVGFGLSSGWGWGSGSSSWD